MGTFVANGQGTTGMLYRRNRYFDPNSGQFTQADPIGIAGGMNAFGFASGDPINFKDPFGLCPKQAGGDGKTEQLDDCEAGTSGYYANKVVKGEGKILNTYLGLGASCGENGWCEGAAFALGGVAVGIAAGAGEALGLNQYVRAGMRTYRGQREFRVAGKFVDWLADEERTHWTSTKVLNVIKSLTKLK
jgi:RHS repeat-associated protein